MNADLVNKVLAKALELDPTLQKHSDLVEKIKTYATGGEGGPAELSLAFGCSISLPLTQGYAESVQLVMALINVEVLLRQGQEPPAVLLSTLRQVYPTLWDHLMM